MEKVNAVGDNAVDRGRRWLRWIVVLGVLMMTLAISPSAQQPPTGTPDEFVPVDSLPAQEELPAAPLVIGAYAVAWLAVFGYMWSIWRRTSQVERDLAELGRRVTARGGPR